jgi:hypothetical protein
MWWGGCGRGRCERGDHPSHDDGGRRRRGRRERGRRGGAGGPHDPKPLYRQRKGKSIRRRGVWRWERRGGHDDAHPDPKPHTARHRDKQKTGRKSIRRRGRRVWQRPPWCLPLVCADPPALASNPPQKDKDMRAIHPLPQRHRGRRAIRHRRERRRRRGGPGGHHVPGSLPARSRDTYRKKRRGRERKEEAG